MAFTVSIEGIDGSGKGTQAQQLCDRLTPSGVRARLLSFPRYEDTLFGRAIGDFLNGRFGRLSEVNPFLVSLLYAGDRFESRQVILDATDTADVVIFDRYVPSNIAHQGAKVEDQERDELTQWIHRIEYDIFQLPRPDVVVLLDLPVQQTWDLIAKKRPRGYTDKPADLQEVDRDYMSKVREVYLQLAASESGWHKVDCVTGEILRSIDEISDEIFRIVEIARGS